MSFHAPNKYRLRNGRLASDDTCGNNGGKQQFHDIPPLIGSDPNVFLTNWYSVD